VRECTDAGTGTGGKERSVVSALPVDNQAVVLEVIEGLSPTM
jgi:hypothetical protein